MSDPLVLQAQSGSQGAFDELASLHRRELHVHCYRLLGSYEDAEDAVQETLLRGWSRISTYAGSSTFRAWLYAIATNVCLDALRRRKSRRWPTDVRAGEPGAALRPAPDVPWLGPYPDALLVAESAEDAVIRREAVELAFLVAIQRLPPRQRAVLILRDVLAWSAKETATALGITPVAVNSALQRAHSTMAANPADAQPAAGEQEQRAIVDRFMAAWEQADLITLAELLAEDARFVMPPLPLWFDGRADVLAFLARRFADHAGGQWRLMPTRSNRSPAVGIYLRAADSEMFEPLAIGVLQLGVAGIKEISLFMGDPTLFELFELPTAA